MKIKIDYDLCEGNAVCMKVAPEVFVVDDSDQAVLLQTDPDLEGQRPGAVRRRGS